MRWLRELLLGARLALAGGRSGWLRTGLTGLGVGLGVALLLVAVSVPHAADARYLREDARQPSYAQVPASDATILVQAVSTEFRDRSVEGFLVQPEGSRPPLPPGVAALPGPGELVVSPALARLLGSPEGALLRERLTYPIVGTIGDEGLASPSELYFYLGADNLDGPGDDAATVASRRVTGFGTDPPAAIRIPDPVLALIVVLVVAVLLAPVGVLAAAATRFGSEARDRRLAGVRLVGSDVRMTRRIAASEALVGSGLGLLAGATMFLMGRSFVDHVSIMDISAFPADLQPDPALTVLLIASVPTVAVLVTMVAMRRVVVEPLGVTRRATQVRRRVWWRLLLPTAGVLLLVPSFGAADPASGAEPVNAVQVGLGLVLILVGVAVLLPWLVQVTISRLRGGPVAWQLATRRLQLDATTATRAVVGIAVAVAGAIGVQTVFASLLATYQSGSGQDPDRADVGVFQGYAAWDQVSALDGSLESTPGVIAVHSTLFLNAADNAAPDGEQTYTVTVANCATLKKIAPVDPCRDGDAFILDDPFNSSLAPGDGLRLGEPGVGEPQEWTVPAGARTVPAKDWILGSMQTGILATPSALPPGALSSAGSWAVSWVWLDRADTDAIEHVRTVAWRADPTNSPEFSGAEAEQSVSAGRALLAGAAAMMVIIGASLLITLLDQIRERRRVLAGLVAFGTRRRTLAWSILWQAAVPIGLGLVLAVGAGLTIAWAVLNIANVSISIDWAAIGVMSGVAAAAVLAVTALGLPLLWRLMRADGLRTE